MPDKNETYELHQQDIKSDEHHDFPDDPPGPPGMGGPDAFTPPGYEPAEEYSPSYPSVICVLPALGKILWGVYNRCLDNGCTFVFATWARQLIRPGNQGVVKGVYVKMRQHEKYPGKAH